MILFVKEAIYALFTLFMLLGVALIFLFVVSVCYEKIKKYL
jgi:hypothetical protein